MTWSNQPCAREYPLCRTIVGLVVRQRVNGRFKNLGEIRCPQVRPSLDWQPSGGWVLSTRMWSFSAGLTWHPYFNTTHVGDDSS